MIGSHSEYLQESLSKPLCAQSHYIVRDHSIAS
jgi:hypothetical protein